MMARHLHFGFLAILALLLPAITLAQRQLLEPLPVSIPEREGVFSVRQPSSGHFVLTWRGMNGGMVEATYESGNKVDVLVEATVDPVSLSNALRYSYRLKSLPSSRQRTYSFVVETAGVVFGMEAPEGWHNGALSFAPAVSWSDTRPPKPPGLKPGESAAGFGFSTALSDGKQRFTYSRTQEPGFFFYRGSLPGIVRCWVRGFTDVFKVPEETPAGLAEALPSFLESSVTGPIVGPVAIPSPFDPVAFIETLRHYNRQSREAGWISEEAAMKRLEVLLKRAREALEEDNRDLARQLLLELLNLARKERDSSVVSSEAHALIRYNAEYLRTILRR